MCSRCQLDFLFRQWKKCNPFTVDCHKAGCCFFCSVLMDRIMFLVNCFLLSLFAFVLLSTHPAFILNLFKALRPQSLSDLIRFKSERPVQHDYTAVSVFAWQWASLEMLWLVFFKLWEKATSGLRATASAVIQNSGILMPRALLARAHLPAVRLSAVRETVSAFYRTMTLITGFIECKENVAVAWGSLRFVTSVVTRCYFDIIKGIVHPKTKILSSLTHPHVVPNLHYLIC